MLSQLVTKPLANKFLFYPFKSDIVCISSFSSIPFHVFFIEKREKANIYIMMTMPVPGLVQPVYEHCCETKVAEKILSASALASLSR